MDLVPQHSYERRHKQSTIQTAVVKDKEKKRQYKEKQTRNKPDYRKDNRKRNNGTTTKNQHLWILRTTKLVTTT